MKTALLILCLSLVMLPSWAADATPSELSLSDGSRLKGRAMSATASEVTVMTEFGVLRIALDKLTAESRAAVTAGSKPDTAALLQRIAELEAKVAQLQTENESLRRTATTPAPSSFRPLGLSSGATTSTSAGSTETDTRLHTISSAGKRHNSGCRYYGSGRACGPTDGIACKICGG